MQFMKHFLFFVMFCCAVAGMAQSAPLKIGWAKESIDPGRSGVMPGFGSFRYSYGTEDPIYATALVIENGLDAVIFVSMDIISSKEIMPEVAAAAERLAPELPADKFLINATHTHSSLNIYYDMSGAPKELGLLDKAEVKRFIAEKVVKAAKKAWQNRKAGRIAYGYGVGVMGFSRRMVYFDDLSKRTKGQYGSDIPYAGNVKVKLNSKMSFLRLSQKAKNLSCTVSICRSFQNIIRKNG